MNNRTAAPLPDGYDDDHDASLEHDRNRNRTEVKQCLKVDLAINSKPTILTFWDRESREISLSTLYNQRNA